MTDQKPDAEKEKPSEKKIRNAYPDRFTVDPPGLEKIGRLLDQLRAAVPACEATRKDILGWLIEKAPDALTASDLNELSDRFYDEERFLKLALDEIRSAKARGERLRLEDILRRSCQPIPSPVRKSSRKQKEASQPGEEIQRIPAVSKAIKVVAEGSENEQVQ